MSGVEARSSTRPARERDHRRAAQLKERVYISFVGLAVVLALGSHAEGLTALKAAGTLLITVLGALLAVFVADVVSHQVVHAALRDRDGVGHMVRVDLGAFTTVVLPSRSSG